MSLTYYKHKLSECLQTVDHIRRYCEHEDIDIPQLRRAVECLEKSIDVLQNSEAFEKERKENFES